MSESESDQVSPPVDMRDEGIVAARGKLEEAGFFLSKMREAESHGQLDQAEREFGWYLSAFLAAVRSAPQVISRAEGVIRGLEEGKNSWAWCDEAKKEWPPDDLRFFGEMKDLRNIVVHRGTGGADSTIEFVPAWDLPFRRRGREDGYVIIVGPPGDPPPRFGVMKFTLKIGGQSLPAVACAERYLALTGRMVNQYVGS